VFLWGIDGLGDPQVVSEHIRNIRKKLSALSVGIHCVYQDLSLDEEKNSPENIYGKLSNLY